MYRETLKNVLAIARNGSFISAVAADLFERVWGRDENTFPVQMGLNTRIVLSTIHTITVSFFEPAGFGRKTLRTRQSSFPMKVPSLAQFI